MSIPDILGPDGVIARSLDSYEPRPQQIDMAQAVADAIAGPHHLMVEAATGVGKSFAYLIPVIQAVTATKNYKVVISTQTISLQEQLLTKDIPFLKKVMPGDFNAILVKGRSNYLSLRRLRVAQQRANQLFSDGSMEKQLLQIGRWSRQTHDGSKSDLTFTPLPQVWDAVQSDKGNCLGRKCSDYNSCFYFRARKQIFGAQIFIVNHALFFADLKLRNEGGSLLPDYQAVIFDEAHTLEDVAADHLGIQFGRGSLDWLLNKLYNPRTRRGLLGHIPNDEALKQLEATRQAGEAFFQSVIAWLSSQQRPASRPGARAGMLSGNDSIRVRESEIVPNALSEELQKLASVIKDLGENMEDEHKIEFTSLADRALGLSLNVSTWLNQGLPGQVYWIDLVTGTSPRLDLCSAPIEVGPSLQQMLYNRVPTVVMTSATLSIGGKSGFSHFQGRLGLEECATAQLGSPFNYEEQAELHLFRNMPDPSTDPAKYEEAVLAKIPEYVERTKGRAFVLFTSYGLLQKAAAQLKPWCAEKGYPLLSQSDGLPRNQMIQRFREAGNAVLLGVDSFWQGVDVRGEALSNVIITKLPFAVPDRPVLQAREEAIEEAGGNAFFEYQVPQAVIKLKQGFGRLIRTTTDTGMVVILDPRVLTKGYGRTFLDALPQCRRFVDGKPAAG